MLTLYSIDTHFNTSTTDFFFFFLNIVGKGEIAHNEQFLLFPYCFLLKQIIVSPFVPIFATISLFANHLEEPTSGISGTRLNNEDHYSNFTFLGNLTYVKTA